MWDALSIPDEAYGLWLGGAAFVGMLVFLRLAAKEWAYRGAWLRADAQRRVKQTAQEARVARHQHVAQGLLQASQAAFADGQSPPVIQPAQPVQQVQPDAGV